MVVMYRLFCILICFYSLQSFSEQEEEQALSFGNFAIGSNSTVSTLTVLTNGSIPQGTNKIYPISLAQPGRYRLSSFPVANFSPLTISIADFSLQLGSRPELLFVTDLVFPSIISTNAGGEAFLDVGATLKTSGTGELYRDGPYRGVINIIVNW